jgi:hypothetical protein
LFLLCLCSLANIIGSRLGSLEGLSLSSSNLLQHDVAVGVLHRHLQRLVVGRLRSFAYEPEDQHPRAGHIIRQVLDVNGHSLTKLQLHVSEKTTLQQLVGCPFLQVRLSYLRNVTCVKIQGMSLKRYFSSGFLSST